MTKEKDTNNINPKWEYLVKKINTAFITLIVSLFYIFIIGLAWVIYTTTKHSLPQGESDWKIPNLKKLPKQYFTSPY